MIEQRDLELHRPATPSAPGLFDSREVADIKKKGVQLYAKNQVRKRLHDDAAYLLTDAEIHSTERFADGVERIDAVVDDAQLSRRDEVAAFAAERKAHLARKLNQLAGAHADATIQEANGSLDTYRQGFWNGLR